jgi:hypothetical protein
VRCAADATRGRADLGDKERAVLDIHSRMPCCLLWPYMIQAIQAAGNSGYCIHAL